MTPHATSTAQVDYSMCVDEVSSSAHAVADSMEVDVSEAVFALNWNRVQARLELCDNELERKRAARSSNLARGGWRLAMVPP
jgi:hypothetical protein